MYVVRTVTFRVPGLGGAFVGTAAALVVLFTLTGCTAGSATTPRTGMTVGIEVRDGAVVDGPRDVVVKRGTSISLKVTTDTVDEVHVHGYDISADVAPGSPATVTFDADIPGAFDIELEDARQPLLSLEVR